MADETRPAEQTEPAEEKKQQNAKRRVQLAMERWLDPDGLMLVTSYARDGLTRKEIAKKMGIGITTLYKWEKDIAEFRKALKNGREWADVTVENALFKSATGYTVTIKKPIKLRTVKVKDGTRYETEEIQYVDEQIHIRADKTAQIFYLKNRKPDVWNDRPQIADALTAAGPLVTIVNDIPRPAAPANVEDVPQGETAEA